MKHPRFSSRTADQIFYSLWLAFDAEGGAFLTRAKPNLKRGQRGMQLNVTLPVALFQTPELSASVTVAKPIAEPVQIDAQAAGEALSKALGFPVDIQIIHAEPAPAAAKKPRKKS